MLKKILTMHTPNGTPLVTASALSTSKVISRALSQNIETVGTWDLLSAVCLERHPIITKPMQDIEFRFKELLLQEEYENSLLSDFEIQSKKEGKPTKKVSTNDNPRTYQTAQEYEDATKQELENFKFAPRISEFEEDNKVVSLKRKLDKNLILLVEQSVGNANFWIPPQSVRKQEETMIQTAHRTVQELCGNDIKVKFYGNAPIGFFQYKYPKDMQDKGQNGAKIFYFLAKYISGDISSNVNYCWLDREELKKTVHPSVHNSLSQFLIPE
ncbi:39S ribosomal protein L46, mitochondrial [Colletes gigas]|uniref:39S ribosomal protein L46, mitochondrial n=1 Tax=Colletes gigas TaxID=935657 RepID=UPI001C9A9DA0|nr:39S ribosomal protein L46, mitochondrial [Colletes gigas]